MPKPKYCWDSCIFVTILTGEERSPEELQGLNEVIDLVDRRRALIITSSIVRTEVLDDIDDPKVRQGLDALFRRSSFLTVDVNNAISDKAGELRNRARAANRRLRVPDAIFVATALTHRVDALHTFDDQLLGWSQQTEVDGLLICRPGAEQTILEL